MSATPVEFPNGLVATPIEGRITAQFAVTQDVLSLEIEARNDALSQILTGTDYLLDIGYKVIGYEQGYPILEISGDVTDLLAVMRDDLSGGMNGWR